MVCSKVAFGQNKSVDVEIETSVVSRRDWMPLNCPTQFFCTNETLSTPRECVLLSEVESRTKPFFLIDLPKKR